MNSHYLFNRVWVDNEHTKEKYIPLSERNWDGKVIKIPTQAVSIPHMPVTFKNIALKVGEP